MNWRTLVLIGLVMIASLANSSRADLPQPGKKKPVPNRNAKDEESTIILAKGSAPVKIVRRGLDLDDKSIKARLIIPKNLLPTEEVGAGPAAPLAPPKAKGKQSHLPPAGTVIAGLAMSLALGSAVYLIRTDKGAKTTAVVTLAAALILGVYSITSADVTTPDRPRRVAEGSNVSIVLLESGDEITLIIDK